MCSCPRIGGLQSPAISAHLHRARTGPTVRHCSPQPARCGLRTRSRPRLAGLMRAGTHYLRRRFARTRLGADSSPEPSRITRMCSGCTAASQRFGCPWVMGTMKFDYSDEMPMGSSRRVKGLGISPRCQSSCVAGRLRARSSAIGHAQGRILRPPPGVLAIRLFLVVGAVP